MIKPITLYGCGFGPNPWKVAVILEELKIPYTHKLIDVADLKQELVPKITVNGRVPAIEDPNTGITLWESGAILEYLIETYDKENTLTYKTSPGSFLVKQWLHFQVSGQGPYFGQAGWFAKLHPERIPSAIDRYKDQIRRVLSVLNIALQGKRYLVGDKCTIADLSFVTWDLLIPWIFDDENEGLVIEKAYPNYYAWNQRLMQRPSVQKIVQDRQVVMARN